MELIKEAVKKAKTALEPDRDHPDAGVDADAWRGARIPATPASRAWQPPVVAVNEAHLEHNRIVSFAAKAPSHVAFNLLRTKVSKIMNDNGWTSLGITSPRKGCGKTTVSLNLAFSLARQVASRTAFVDLDLKKTAVARTLGVSATKSVSQYLEGKAEFEECFVRIGENLVVAPNSHPTKYSAELMHGPRLSELIARVKDSLRPNLTIYDLPPMQTSDDALAFLPRVDAALLVIEAGRTVADDVDECIGHIEAATNFLGIVFNKSEELPRDYYYDL